MKIENVPFTVTDWGKVETQTVPGESGEATVRSFEQGNVRVRTAEYSPGYRADHWCLRGHVVLILEGEITVEIQDGRKFVLKKGMSFQVADGIDAHLAHTQKGALAFIVD